MSRPCPAALVSRAARYADERERAYDPASSLLLHGDAHVWNTLEDPSQQPSGYRFVDPDGLFGERAIDLAISLREWREDLLSGNTLERGRARCAMLGQLTGVEPAAIWQWGFIEQVACGLLDEQLGDRQNASQHYTIAERWLTD